MTTATSKTRTAIVTGANRGIGLAIAKGLSKNKNIRVLAAARKVKDAVAAVRDIGKGSIVVKMVIKKRIRKAGSFKNKAGLFKTKISN